MKKRVIVIFVALALLGGGVAAALLLGRAATPTDRAEAPERVANDVMAVDEKGATQTEDSPEGPSADQEELGTPVTMAEAPVFTTTRESGLTVTAPDAFLSTEQLADVEACISDLEARGATVCVSLTDLTTRRGLWLNVDEVMYPASSIKAVYCIYLFETHGGSGGQPDMVERVLVDSDNEAYYDLPLIFGFYPWASWLQSHGAPVTASGASGYSYPDTTTAELAAIWEEIYRYGTSDEAGASELAGYLARTNFSPIAEELRGDCEVWSKPGWFPLDSNNIPATNDAGVVFSETGPYVMAIMTDISSDLESLKPLIRALDAAHTLMCGDDVAYYE